MKLRFLISSMSLIFVYCSTQKASIAQSNLNIHNNNIIIQKVRDVDAFLTASGVNGGLLIAHKEKLLVNKGYGWANENTKVAISPNSIFNIGSVTKQFTGAAILKLQEQGKLKTTDSITKFFNSVPSDKKGITIHQLLSHTAGFVHDAAKENITTLSEAVKQSLASKLKFTPGEKFAYSNAGYQLLAAIIEIASGNTYEQYLHQNLWKPAGMLFTGNYLPNWDKRLFVSSYDIAGDVDKQNKNLWGESGQSSWNVGAGGLLSTLNDLYKWHQSLNTNKILSAESKSKLFAPYVQFKAAIGPAHYTYGWAIQETPLGTLIEHNGGNGYNFTDFYRYIDEDLLMVYFTNERHTLSLRTLDSVPSFIYGKQLPSFPNPKLSLSQQELKSYAGTYHLPSGKRITVELINNDLSIKAIEIEASKLFTNFPKLKESELAKNLQQRTENVMSKIAKDSLRQIADQIDLEGTLEEEKAYWDRTFTGWKERFGEYRKTEMIGSVYNNNFLTTYAFIEFEKGRTIVEFRQSEQKKFFIGHPSFLLPRYYRFIPQSKTEFLTYNHQIQTSTKITFNKDGMVIHSNGGHVFAKKIL